MEDYLKVMAKTFSYFKVYTPNVLCTGPWTLKSTDSPSTDNKSKEVHSIVDFLRTYIDQHRCKNGRKKENVKRWTEKIKRLLLW